MALPISVRLEYPPTMNTYWRRAGHHVHLSAKAKKYRASVIDDLVIAYPDKVPCFAGRLRLSLYLHMPDRRKRDIDNIIKPLIDALMHAECFVDDEQIDELVVKRGPIDPPGAVDVILMEVVGAV